MIGVAAAPADAGIIRIASAHVRAGIDLLGARVDAPEFRLSTGNWAAPLARAPWPDDASLPGHVRRLGGEFFCLPFGGAGLACPPPGWPKEAANTDSGPLHGPAANAQWKLVDHRTDQATVAINYPADHPVASIERTIRCDGDAARLTIEVVISARCDTMIAAAFHPMLALPDLPGALSLEIDATFGRTYPEPYGERFAVLADRQFETLAAVPAMPSGTVDLTRLPLAGPSEALVQLVGVRGPIRARCADAGWTLSLDWDRALLPDCVLWLSDRGLAGPPWNNSFRAVGLEPCAAAFDLPRAVAAMANPLRDAGARTALALVAGLPTRLWCVINVT